MFFKNVYYDYKDCQGKILSTLAQHLISHLETNLMEIVKLNGIQLLNPISEFEHCISSSSSQCIVREVGYEKPLKPLTMTNRIFHI